MPNNWADGDYLTPTNLNTKGVGGAFTDRTYNAADFAGATNEAKITACIDQLLIDFPTGTKICFVPASMLPYDASAVTFNNAVHMLREGGNPSLGVYDPYAYGAGGSAANDTAAINALATIIVSTTNPDGSVGAGILEVPQGRTLDLNRPLLVTTNGVNQTNNGMKIKGGWRTEGAGASRIRSVGYAYGPIICAGGNHSFPTGAALATGTGVSFAPTSSTHYMNWRDATTLDVNGLSALCVRTFFKPAATSDGYIIASQGASLKHDTLTRAFNISVSGGVFSARLTTSVTGLATLTSAVAPVAATTVYLALTYDGTTARLFHGIPGGTASVIASAAMTGTVVQASVQDVAVGVGFSNSPEGGIESGLAGGTGSLIHSLEVLNTATYTASFTAPTAEHTFNATNTLCLMNCDLQYGPMTRCKTINGDAWMVCRRTGSGLAGPVVEVEDVLLESATAQGATGIFLMGGTYRPKVNRVFVHNCRNGLVAPVGNTYAWRFGELYMDGLGRYGLQLGPNSGIGAIDTAWIQGGIFPLFSSAGVVLNNVFVQCEATAEYGAALIAASLINVTASGLVINTEVGVATSYRGALLLQAFATQTLVGEFRACVFEAGNSVPPVLLDGATAPTQNRFAVTFDTCEFGTTGASSVMKVNGGAAFNQLPVHFENCFIIPWAPYSDVAGTAVVGPIGPKVATFSATPTFDCSLGDSFSITVTGNVTSSTLSNVTPGQRLTFWIKQSGGGFTFAWPSNVKGGGTISGTDGFISTQEFEVDLAGDARAVSAMQYTN